MRENFKERLLNTVINVNVRLKEAASKGNHILDYDSKSRGARDYLALAGEIITKKSLLKIPA